MEYNNAKPISANSSLCNFIENNVIVCFEYKLNNSYNNNNFNYANDMNSMISKKKHLLPSISPLKNNNNISNEEEHIHFNEKRNYSEDELLLYHNEKQCSSQRKALGLDIDFNIHNSLDFPMDLTSNQLIEIKDNQQSSTIDFNHNLFPKTNEAQHQFSIENQDEENRLISVFVHSTDHKPKQ